MTIIKTLTCLVNKDSATISLIRDSQGEITICIDDTDKESTDTFGSAYLVLPSDVAKELANSILRMVKEDWNAVL